MSWNQKAELVREGLSQELLLGRLPYSTANVLIAAWIGLAHIPGCPTEFQEKAKTLEMGCDKERTFQLINNMWPFFLQLCDAA